MKRNIPDGGPAKSAILELFRLCFFSANSPGGLPTTEQPLTLLHPGAEDPKRRWPYEKFAQIGDILARNGWLVAITGTETEQEIVAHVATSMHQSCLNLCGRLSLGGLVALLARSCVVVCNHLWTVWLRKSPGKALFETASLLKQALTKRSVRKGTAEALRGLPWVLKERKAPGSQ